MIAVLIWTAAGCGGAAAPSAAAATSTLSILRGSVFVRATPAGAETAGADGATLAAGARVRTGPDAHALITFFDGSTIELEPETTLTVTRAEPEDGASRIRIDQDGGRVWARVVALTDSRSRFEIATPTAVASVRGSLIGAGLAADGEMTCWVIEGRLYVTAQGQEVVLASGQESVTPPGAPPGAPRTRSIATSMLRLRWSGEGFARLVDPNGRTVGFAPPGIEVNQIRNALTSHPSQRPAFIDLPDPPAGDYTIVVEAPGGVGFRADLVFDATERPPVSQALAQTIPAGGRIGARLALRPDRAEAPVEIGPFGPIDGPAPGQVIVRDREMAARPAATVQPVPTLPVR